MITFYLIFTYRQNFTAIFFEICEICSNSTTSATDSKTNTGSTPAKTGTPTQTTTPVQTSPQAGDSCTMANAKTAKYKKVEDEIGEVLKHGTFSIGFIGLAMPHLARMTFRTADHRVLMPATILWGALSMLLCSLITDIVAHHSMIIPVNTITALLGVPIIIFVIIRNRNRQ